MTILGLDTATPSTAVALLVSDGALHEARDDVAGGGRGAHAERVLPLAASLLERAALAWSDVDVIAVGVGPGGYTGLRIGIATARGLALSLQRDLVGIGTLRALAEPVLGATALTILDARRAELFVAAYADDVEVLAPCVISSLELTRVAAAVGAESLLAIGDGALAQRVALEAAGVAVADERSPLHCVSAGATCRLAASAAQRGAASAAPVYLRLPDAELALRASS
ncbi:MAG: tRNA (adenosine(37)-N6)-threonylcarbamoyltransferase complex dimerization subunit type 1 TsaB [Solirubrobacteraceae bacterium]|jgi:tRNA threonylcarbamoyladenosine biosynthesis protein TsaB